MFSSIFMNMQIRYNLHTCVLPLDEGNVSKPHIGSLDDRTCQIVSLMILTTCNNDCLDQKYVYVFMIFPHFKVFVNNHGYSNQI